jgi:hypothetical protein
MTTTRDLLSSVLDAHGLTLRWRSDDETAHGLVADRAIPTPTAYQICRDLIALGVIGNYSPDVDDASVAWIYAVDAPVYRVWLGHRASGWRQRYGYEVVGECVQTRLGREDALHIARIELGADIVSVECEDGTYCYRDQDAADADETGVQADAVISLCEEV